VVDRFYLSISDFSRKMTPTYLLGIALQFLHSNYAPILHHHSRPQERNPLLILLLIYLMKSGLWGLVWSEGSSAN